MSKYYKAEDIFQVIDKIIQNATEVDADIIMGTDLVIEINKLPTIDLEAEPVRHGKWIEEKDGWYGGQGCRCSSCGYGYSYKAYHEPYEFSFCPNCGAKIGKE